MPKKNKSRVFKYLNGEKAPRPTRKDVENAYLIGREEGLRVGIEQGKRELRSELKKLLDIEIN